MTEITLKQGTGKPAPTDLVQGEMAIDHDDLTLWAERSSNGEVAKVGLRDFLALDGANQMEAALDMNSNSVLNVPLPSDNFDAANKLYVDMSQDWERVDTAGYDCLVDSQYMVAIETANPYVDLPTLGDQEHGKYIVLADTNGDWGTPGQHLTVNLNGPLQGQDVGQLVLDISSVIVTLMWDGYTWVVYTTVGGVPTVSSSEQVNVSKNLTDIFPPSSGGGGGGGIEEAPKTGKMYARKDETWQEFATGNLEPGNGNDDVLLWDTIQDEWMPSKYVPSAFASSSTPGSPKQGMLWLNTSNNLVYVYTGSAWIEIVDKTGYVKTVNSKSPNSSGAVSLTYTDVNAEKAFSKNTAFNKAFGTASGQVAQGNHTHSNYATTSYAYSKAQSDSKYQAIGSGGTVHDQDTALRIKSVGIGLGGSQQVSSFATYPILEMQTASGINGGLASHSGFRLSCGMPGGWDSQNIYFNTANNWAAYNPTPALTIANTGCTSADFIATSDERLKDNIEMAPLGVIDQLNGRTWDWKRDGKKQSGVVAQEIEAAGLGHLVTEDQEGMKAVSYNGLTAYLIEELKDCRRRIAELEAKS